MIRRPFNIAFLLFLFDIQVITVSHPVNTYNGPWDRSLDRQRPYEYGLFSKGCKGVWRSQEMKLSTRGRYGMRLMVELARHFGQGPLSMRAISHNQNIPVKYLEQLIIPLKRGGLIESARGPKGGHMLTKPPDEINAWEVLNILESRLELVNCLDEPSLCENSDDCLIRPIWGRAHDAMKRVFEETSLSDILAHVIT
jgi:Rrf2 family protein